MKTTNKTKSKPKVSRKKSSITSLDDLMENDFKEISSKPKKKTKKEEEKESFITPIVLEPLIPLVIHGNNKFDDKFCMMLIEHMAKGYSFTSFAGVVGVTRMTLHNWRTKHKEFQEAFSIGLEKGRMFWEMLGMDLVTGMSKGSARAWEINMFNRFREDWKLKTHDTSEDKTVEIKLKYEIPNLVKKEIAKEEEDK